MTDSRSGLKLALIMAPLLLGLAGGPAFAQAEQRAAIAVARGDLRAAQIELRNAVRQNPQATTARVALARVSLELGDGETAAREARAALDQGFDRVAGTALLLRAHLVSGRHDALLQAFPEPPREPASPVERAVGGEVAAARVLALLSLGETARAAEALDLARHLAPDSPETALAAASVALAQGDRAAAEAAIDAVLARDPQQVDALIRKGSILFERGEPREAILRFDRAITASPGNTAALLRRAEVLLAINETPRAQRDIDTALAVIPGSAAAHYLRALIAARAQDWAAADASLQRVGPLLANFRDGFLMLAAAKRGLGQREQAEDAARRHLARYPDDGRAGRLLASIALEANRIEDATATLADMARRGTADAASLDMLGGLHSAAGRRREAAAAFEAAGRLAPNDAALLARIAAARLTVGDITGSAQAAQEALRLDPNLGGTQELLAFAALHRGSLEEFNTRVEQLPAEARGNEGVGVLRAASLLMQVNIPGARAAYQEVLARHPNSIAALLGLTRIARLEGNLPETERLLAEVLRLDPANRDALTQLLAAATPGAPRAAEARAVLEAARAAAPADATLALAFAGLLTRAGEGARALAMLETVPATGQAAVPLHLARSEAHVAANNLDAALQAGRSALAEQPDSVAARRQVAGLLLRSGDPRGAELVLEQGVRERPGDAALQQVLVMVVRDARGVDAALALADRLAANPQAQPAASSLKGDLLLAAQRPAEAAAAHAAAQAQHPSPQGARRLAGALRAAGKPEEARAALAAWIERTPDDEGSAILLAQIDIEARRFAAGVERLEAVIERRPDSAVALNNLAWVLGEHGGEGAAARARRLAERAYFLAPTPQIADTLGWILARHGEAARAVPLLRQAADARGSAPPDPTAAYRLAFALNATGARDEALSVLTAAMDGAPADFPDRAAATRLLTELRGRR